MRMSKLSRLALLQDAESLADVYCQVTASILRSYHYLSVFEKRVDVGSVVAEGDRTWSVSTSERGATFAAGDMIKQTISFVFRCVFCGASVEQSSKGDGSLHSASLKMNHANQCPITVLKGMVEKEQLSHLIRKEIQQLALDYDYDQAVAEDGALDFLLEG